MGRSNEGIIRQSIKIGIARTFKSVCDNPDLDGPKRHEALFDLSINEARRRLPGVATISGVPFYENIEREFEEMPDNKKKALFDRALGEMEL